LRLLLDKSISTRVARERRSDGIDDVILFVVKFRYCRLLSFPKVVGNDPFRALFAKFKYVRLVRSPSEVGTVPGLVEVIDTLWIDIL
jgi:hypothetical protein